VIPDPRFVSSRPVTMTARLFSCGVESLDRYLREQASQDARKRAAAPFVLRTADNRIAGY